MKKMKKLASLLLASVMALSMTATAFAAPTDPAEGTGDLVVGDYTPTAYSITVKNQDERLSMEGTYSAYKVFDVTYNKDTNVTNKGAYAYTVAEAFKDFKYTVGEGENAKVYQGEDLVNYLGEFSNNATELDAFAGAVLAYIKERDISASTAVSAASDAESVKIDLAEAGYYLVTSKLTEEDGETVTAACALTTTNPDANVNVKVDVPTIDKVIVNADSTNGGDGNGTAQDVGSKVTFKLESAVPKMTGYESYVYTVHDTLSSGLTFDGESTVKVKIGSQEYTKDSTFTEGEETKSVFTVVTQGDPLKDGESFAIVFNNIISETAGATIEITYTATINEGALSTNVETNTVYLEYSNSPYPTEDGEKPTNDTPEKKVYVYDFDIVIDKYEAGSETTKLLGAKFVLYKEETTKAEGTDTPTTNYFAYYYDEEDKVVWTPITLAEGQTIIDALNAIAADENTTIKITEKETDKDGVASFQGLDSGTYHLVETVAPNGYNKLKDATDVVITATYNEDGTLANSNATVGDNNGQYSLTAKVANNAGTQLPSTGGIGTTIFYAAGIILMAGAVFFVIRRRRA